MSTGKYTFSHIFPERLKSLMEAGNLTQAQVGTACGVAQPTVQRWLKGAMPGGLEFYKLTQVLGVSPEFLLFENAPSQRPIMIQEQSVKNKVKNGAAQKIREHLRAIEEILEDAK